MESFITKTDYGIILTSRQGTILHFVSVLFLVILDQNQHRRQGPTLRLEDLDFSEISQRRTESMWWKGRKEAKKYRTKIMAGPEPLQSQSCICDQSGHQKAYSLNN